MREFFAMLTSNAWGIAAIVLTACLVFFLISALFYKLFFKRLYDIVLSGFALVALSPILLFLTVLIRQKLGKPALFKQKRPGKNNRIFTLHKFRTMTNECDANGDLLPDEQRLTKFGKLLRSLSLDELPELWDIFRGKMSIIGPRPQLVRDLVFMNDEIKARHKVRGGLSGLAQVKGRNNIDWNERFAFDLEYVKKISIFKDIKLILLTILKVFKKADVATDGMATSEDYGDYLLCKDEITEEEYTEKMNLAKDMLSEARGKNEKKLV
jgi:lipopolysaccharide/colanic/teichoic acid biosynthesis glycosyltransferase